jgi:type III restriction enzyme
VTATEDGVAALVEPILNGPYDPPERHFVMGPNGPTGEVKPGRRPSESLVPIAQAKKSRSASRTADLFQDELDLDVTGERREKNTLINDLRREVDLWRARGYPRVTAITRNLLEHWADPTRENRVLYAQREAAETAIYLTEVAGREGNTAWNQRLATENTAHNDGLPRVGLKMATGTGKTVVMAMIITWQTLNKVTNPQDSRFAKRFLVVAPGITIRDRLRVLVPGDPGNYYDQRDLVPAKHQRDLREAQVVITNYHAFSPRDAKEIQGVNRTTRQILLGDRIQAGSDEDPFRESPDAVVSRVLRGFTLPAGRRSTKSSEIVVLNDEAHHCYRYNPDLAEGLSKEEREANKEAGVWFTGLRWVQDRVGVKSVYDLSATPFYLKASGYDEGYVFPWVVSDFSLMDAIESGLVKVPRTPVDDDAEGDRVTYLHLWEHVGKQLPARRAKNAVMSSTWTPPKELEGALQSLYRSYERSYEHWDANLRALGEPPPVYIVVANNTVVSKLIYDWIAGGPVLDDDGNPVLRPGGSPVLRPGSLPLFSNVSDGAAVRRPPTLVVDSTQLESGESMSPEFKKDAAEEIERFKAELRRRNPGLDVSEVSDEDLLREVMNTVGKRGTIGEQVRCVVSVSMLTEGWDANTVTHILGVRAFGSQLLCEQVVGRGLRRRSYALNAEGRFEPEYANVYGIPFSFIPTTKDVPEPTPRPPAVWVHTVEGREHLRIRFPKVDGYRLEIPDEQIWLDPAAARQFVVGRSTVPRWTESAGVVGSEEMDDGDQLPLRTQELAYLVARRLIDNQLRTTRDSSGDTRPWLFPKVAEICRKWIDEFVVVEPGYRFNTLRLAEAQAELADHVNETINSQQGARRARVFPILRTLDPAGDTGEVSFETRKASRETVKSEVSHVVLDGVGGNTWEEELAAVCESIADVEAYVKNDHVGLTIPYVHKGRSHDYLPDFVLRLRRRDDGVERYLIVEVSGGQKSPGPTRIKASTARDSWCAAVNNHGGFGRWGYIEVTEDKATFFDRIREAIDLHYADAPIVGDPDLLDLEQEARHGA